MPLDESSAGEVLDLHHQGKSVEEIAEASGLDIGDVQSVLAGATLTGPRPAVTPTPGVVRIVKFDFAHDTPGLASGGAPSPIVAYRPTAGELLIDAWFDVTTLWAESADLATQPYFDDGGTGWFADTGPAAVNLANLGDARFGVVRNNASGTLANWRRSNPTYLSGLRDVPMVLTAEPLRVVVSDDGSTNGSPAADSSGAATLYLAVATPA